MRLINLASRAALIYTAAIGAIAQTSSQVSTPIDLPSYIYTGPALTLVPPRSSETGQGMVDVAVELEDPPLAVVVGANAKQNGIAMSADQQRAYLAQLGRKQDALMNLAKALGGVEIGRVSKAHNALMISVDASRMELLLGIQGVVAVRPLGERPPLVDAATLTYIGANAVHNTGATGAGIRVAMLDTGIDYTHFNLAGSGNTADYSAAVAAKSGKPPANLFPTQKVIGGYDFAGDCPATPCRLLPDPNPIDIDGHGTATADTLGGKSLDGSRKGTAPGVQLYALKVFYSGGGAPDAAILPAIDFALDPTGSGTLNNPVDIISMSFGIDFGQREDPLLPALTNAVNFGVVCVAAAGNDGNIPYVLASPASTPEVITVAATKAVDAFVIPLVINSPANIAGTYANTATMAFAPVTAAITGNVAYVGQGCPAGSISATSPDDPYLANPTGKIALIDRGACAISLKIERAANSGAIAALIGLVGPGDAIEFVVFGGSNFVPSLVITQAESNTIKSALNSSAVNVTISPQNTLSVAGSAAGYSSRGPSLSYNMLKPDLCAPGTVVSAVAGTGNGLEVWQGTSFSCPLVAGAAALLLSRNRLLSPLDVKAILMESSEPAVFNNTATQPGSLAPVSRVGAGELRIDRAMAASTSAWDASDPLAVSLSFGTYRLNVSQTFRKKVVVRNYSNTDRTYLIANSYRGAPNTTGVTVSFPPSIFVPANGAANFNVALTVSPSTLPNWTLNGGSNGNNGELLNTVEYAGYLNFLAGAESAHLPWHILPHKSANVLPAASSLALNGAAAALTLTNTDGATPGLVNVFSLIGVGVEFPPSLLPAPGSGRAAVNLQYAGVRLMCAANCSTASPNWNVQFAVSTFGQRSHPDYPAEFDVRIDVNNDGASDLIVFNEDIGYASTQVDSGQNGVFVYDIAANSTTGPYFFNSADLDSANVILTVPLSALQTAAGLRVALSTQFTIRVRTVGNYYTLVQTDQIGPALYELDMPRFYAGATSLFVQPNAPATVPVFPNNATTPYLSGPYNGKSPSQTGLLLMYTDGKARQEASIVTVTP